MLRGYGATTSPRSVNSPRWRRRSALALSAASVARCTRSPCPGRELRCRGTPPPPPPSSRAVAGVYRRVSSTHGTLFRSAQDVVSLHLVFQLFMVTGFLGGLLIICASRPLLVTRWCCFENTFLPDCRRSERFQEKQPIAALRGRVPPGKGGATNS